MSGAFDRALSRLIGIEGGYSDHAADSGGKTRYGVTESLARYYGFEGDMRAYPLALARHVYRQEFWNRLRLDEVASFSEALAFELFELQVNTPAGTAARFLQRLLNALNDGGRHYADIAVDGKLGPQSIAALRSCLGRRDAERVLLAGLNALQGAYYVELAERRAKDEAFVFGWLRERVVIPQQRQEK